MTTLGLLILGIVAFNFIPMSLMPDIDIPEITIKVKGDNMSARQVENVLLKKIRTHLLQVQHIKNIESEASNEQGTITLTFNQGTNIDYSFIEVNEKIDRIISSFPKSIQRPKVIKASVTDIPVFYLNMSLNDKSNKPRLNDSISGNHSFNSHNLLNFSRFSNQVIRKQIEQIDEVAMVDVSGIVNSEIVIIPNHKKLKSLQISLDDIELAIKKHELEVNNLLIKDGQYQYNISLGTSLKNINEIKNVILKKGTRLFSLKDISNIIERPKDRKGLILSNDSETITMAIIKQSDARMNDLKSSLNQLINGLKKEYPEINFSITRDQTKLLDFAIGNMKSSLFWGIFLAFSIMVLFLKNIKPPLLIGISIPVSIIISLLFFYLLNISINIISLSGLVLGIGLMIDNSIIVIDNITQYSKRKEFSIKDACILGTNEVRTPLLTSALTTCAVFLPLIFLSGIAGSLFFDQALAISISLFVSFIVSITLLPVLFHLLHLKKSNKDSSYNFVKKNLGKHYLSIYKKGFRFTLRKQFFSWGISLFLFISSIVLFISLPKEEIPYITKTETILKIDWNKQINLNENKRRILKLLGSTNHNLLDYTAFIGSQQFILDKNEKLKTSESFIYIKANSSENLNEVITTLNNFIKNKYKEALITTQDVDNIFNLLFPNKKPILIAQLQNGKNKSNNHKNYELNKIWHEINQNLDFVNLDPIQWQEHISILINQEKLILYNITPSQLIKKLKSSFGIRQVTTILDNKSFIPVIIGGNINNIHKTLGTITIQTNDSTHLPIKNFIKETRSKSLKKIIGGSEGEYFPLQLDIKAFNVDNTIKTVNKIVDSNKFFNVSFTGTFFSNQKLIKELKIILLVSLLLLYFILAAQFESFTLPLIILIEVPIDIAGAFFFLKCFGMSINLMSMIGIIVMSGIIINDSILKIDSIIQLQKQGYSIIKALLVAGEKRLKPILMTSLTTIFALIPLLFSSGIGADLQAPLAISLIGGMLLGTLVSLYFIPLCYFQIIGINKTLNRFKNKICTKIFF